MVAAFLQNEMRQSRWNDAEVLAADMISTINPSHQLRAVDVPELAVHCELLPEHPLGRLGVHGADGWVV